MKFFLIVFSFFSSLSFAQDAKYCGFTKRTESGEIQRSSSELAKFKKLYPCPSTGKSTGNCPDWSVDHIIPLACGGCDSVTNMQWLKNSIKSCPGTECKDRWERKIYCKN